MSGKTMPEIISHFHSVKSTGADKWSALCPAHDDHHPSLSIALSDDSNVLLTCWSQKCTVEAIAASAGLDMRDLFNVGIERSESKRGASTARSCAKRAYPNGYAESDIVEAYTYTDESGTVLYQNCRLKPVPEDSKPFRQRRPDGNGGWIPNMRGIETVPYHLPQLAGARDTGAVVLFCEGEKDVHTAEALGFIATTTGNAYSWKSHHGEHFGGLDVICLPDNDKPGRDYARQALTDIYPFAASVKLIELPGLPEKGDLSDWAEAGGTAQGLQPLIDAAPEWEPTTESECAAEDSKTAPSGQTVYSPLYNAEAFYSRYGADVRYNGNDGVWLHWNDAIWGRDTLGIDIKRIMLDTVRGLYDQLSTIPNHEAQRLLAHIKASESDKGIQAALDMLKLLDGVTVAAKVFDSDPWSVSVQNGTVDLKTGKLRDFDRDDHITVQLPVNYNPALECPRWIRFLEEIFPSDPETAEYVQRVAGYLLCGDTSRQELYILYGKPSCGKSVLAATLMRILGGHAASLLKSQLLLSPTGQVNDRQAIAGTWDKRLVTCSEFDAKDRLDEGLIRALTGDDEISVRHIYGKPFDVRPRFKLLLFTNFIPRFQSVGYDMKRRLRMIPFGQTFYSLEDGKYPRRDDHLREKLWQERDGIFARMVQGCLDLQRSGIPMSAAVKECTDSVFETMDVLADFLEARCVLDVRESVLLKDLWRALEMWCSGNARKMPFGDNRGLRANLQNRDGVSFRRIAPGWLVEGVGLQDSCGNVDNVDRPPFHEKSPMIDEHEKFTENTPLSTLPTLGEARTSVESAADKPWYPCECGETVYPEPRGNASGDYCYTCPACGVSGEVAAIMLHWGPARIVEANE